MLVSFGHMVNSHDPGGISHWYSLARNAEHGNRKNRTDKQTNKNNKMTKKNLMNMEDVWLFKIGTKINDYLLYTIFILSA